MLRNYKYVSNQIQKHFVLHNHFKIQKERSYIRIRAKTKNVSSINQFCNNFKTDWEYFYENTKSKVDTIVRDSFPKYITFTDRVEDYINVVKNSQTLAFKTANLFKMIQFLGNAFDISSINEIRADSMVSHNNFELRLKEFHLRFQEKNMDYYNKVFKKNQYVYSNIKNKHLESLSEKEESEINESYYCVSGKTESSSNDD
jgi:hypothetical protein